MPYLWALASAPKDTSWTKSEKYRGAAGAQTLVSTNTCHLLPPPIRKYQRPRKHLNPKMCIVDDILPSTTWFIDRLTLTQAKYSNYDLVVYCRVLQQLAVVDTTIGGAAERRHLQILSLRVARQALDDMLNNFQ